jgi:hypothetical protein
MRSWRNWIIWRRLGDDPVDADRVVGQSLVQLAEQVGLPARNRLRLSMLGVQGGAERN